jgi:hypothetical protein
VDHLSRRLRHGCSLCSSPNAAAVLWTTHLLSRPSPRPEGMSCFSNAKEGSFYRTRLAADLESGVAASRASRLAASSRGTTVQSMGAEGFLLHKSRVSKVGVKWSAL